MLELKGPIDILIDCVCTLLFWRENTDRIQGDADNFYKGGQLLPENFVAAAKASGHGENDITLRLQPGYDHSYYFISSFMEDHVAHAAKYLSVWI